MKFRAVVAAMAVAVAGLGQLAIASQPSIIQGNHPAQAEKLAPVSYASPDQVLELEIHFALRNQPELDRLLVAQQDPASPRFHRWLSSREFNRRFGARQPDVDAVAKWLSANGFAVRSARASDGFISASGTVAQAEQAFTVRIANFADGSVYGNTTDPVLPAEFAGIVSNVLGLDNMSAVAPASRKPKVPRRFAAGIPARARASRAAAQVASAQEAAPAPASGISIKPNFNHNGFLAFGPGDIQTFYNESSLLAAATGSDGCIAIIGLSNYPDSAITLFNSTFGLPASNIRRRIVNSDPGINSFYESETLLDLEWSHATAPGAPINYYFGAGNGAFIKAISGAVNENACGVISISFGLCGDSKSMFTGTIDSLFKKAAAQGQSVFVSSGDEGAAGLVYDPSTHGCSTGTGRNVNELSADPNVTSVGGTGFTPNYDSSGNDVGDVPESAWNDAEQGVFEGEATGGGMSSIFNKPQYQVGTPSDGRRDVPDIALIGSPAFPGVYLGDDTGTSVVIDCCWGGTSLAAPLWAGFARVVSQFSSFRLGNINFALYKLANQGQAANGFRDVTSGDNSFNGVTGFPAIAGYDQATGWGTPDMTTLASALKSVGPPPSGTIKLTPAKPNLGKVSVGAAGKVKKLMLAFTPRSKGQAGVTEVDIIPIAPTPNGQFQIDPASTTCGKSAPLPCTIGVVFTPTAKGVMQAKLIVTDHATNSPQIATLKGTGK